MATKASQDAARLRYEADRKRAGCVQVRVWVPAGADERRVKELARKLTAKALRDLGLDARVDVVEETPATTPTKPVRTEPLQRHTPRPAPKAEISVPVSPAPVPMPPPRQAKPLLVRKPHQADVDALLGNAPLGPRI